jgi:hypothetical protein
METTSTETNAVAEMFPVIKSIAESKLPVGLAPEKIRHLDQKERSAKIRGLLKACGIKGVSVTSAVGSMCYWTNVRFETPDHLPGTDFTTHLAYECPVCRVARLGEKIITGHILAAFPDLDDRSDSQVDHFDYVFSVRGV